ncbi:hypothetical protein [uncultured Microbulbifer sp.]|uniref:hypothetical protein n=1 Tax=uncultured Microbulbifer sp. TaxID=348147 RepID=UPI00261C5809|nr:hypothetical protein [uncultured Microbulbifer sp.]
MRCIAAMILSALPITVFAAEDSIDLSAEQKPLLSVWNEVVEKCSETYIDHRIVHTQEPVTLKVEGVSCRDVLKMLVDFDKGVNPSSK